ncbi:MAG: hypothetical protein EOP04_05245 [Proteobacteria bacterium]|nr:MAG: hypothetical protein EOP04_05245 [Pseudomonadota bacterium]
MTALVFVLEEDQICIAMDTLVSSASDRLPMSFQRKFLILPTSELIIAGTGHAGFVNGWLQYFKDNFFGMRIEELNLAAPNVLRNSLIASGGSDGLTATIYHFGYSEQECRYIGYAYRSERDFQADKLQDGLAWKPVVPITANDDIRFPDFLIAVMLEQQRRDYLLPTLERVGIGGEIDFVTMSNRSIHVETVHRFSSYESEAICIQKRALS